MRMMSAGKDTTLTSLLSGERMNGIIDEDEMEMEKEEEFSSRKRLPRG